MTLFQIVYARPDFRVTIGDNYGRRGRTEGMEAVTVRITLVSTTVTAQIRRQAAA